MSIALTPQESGFFQKRLEALPIYITLRQKLAGFPGLAVQAQKTQISFCNPRMFACVSFLAPLPKREMPPLLAHRQLWSRLPPRGAQNCRLRAD